MVIIKMHYQNVGLTFHLMNLSRMMTSEFSSWVLVEQANYCMDETCLVPMRKLKSCFYCRWSDLLVLLVNNHFNSGIQESQNNRVTICREIDVHYW